MTTLITKMFSGLVPIDQAKQQLSSVADVSTSVDIGDKIKACRRYDSKTKERRDYWGELSLWNDRNTGKLIQEAKKKRLIGHAHSNQKNTSSVTLTELLGVDGDKAENFSRTSQKLAKPDEASFNAAIEKIKEAGEEVSRAAVIRVLENKSVLVTKMTGNNERYTPAIYIEAARAAMGSIDVDPASNKHAQKTIQAGKYYTAKNSGLDADWAGNVWLNPPYEKGLVDLFADKLLLELEAGNTTAAIVLTNNSTDSGWFQKLFIAASATAFPKKRIQFYDANDEKTSPTNGQTFFYFGNRACDFQTEFSKFGPGCMGAWK
jgi:hypothetical protein